MIAIDSRRIVLAGCSQGAAVALHTGLRYPEPLAGIMAHFLPAEAERRGITVVRVPEDQLLLFIGEAREGFREHFSGGATQ